MYAIQENLPLPCETSFKYLSQNNLMKEWIQSNLTG